jgi:hypothetical protein
VPIFLWSRATSTPVVIRLDFTRPIWLLFPMIHLAHRNPSLLKLRQTFSSSSSFTPSCISSLNNKKQILQASSPPPPPPPHYTLSINPTKKNKIRSRFTEILRQPDTQISQFRNCVNDERQEEEDNKRTKSFLHVAVSHPINCDPRS